MPTYFRTTSVKDGNWFEEDTWPRIPLPDDTFLTIPNGKHMHVDIINKVVLTGTHDVEVHDLSIRKGARLDVENSANLTTAKLDNDGVLDVHGAGHVRVLNLSENFRGATIVAKNGGVIEFEADFRNQGTILSDNGGYIKFDRTVGNSGGPANVGGTLVAQDGGQIEVVNQANAGPKKEKAELIGSDSVLKLMGGGDLNVEFHNGSQKLVLNNSDNFSGKIANFARGDIIDVLDVNFNSPNFQASYKSATRVNDPVLTVSDGQHATKLTIVGVHQLDDFTLFSDPSGTGLMIGLL